MAILGEHITEKRLYELTSKPDDVSQEEDSHIEVCELCLKALVEILKRRHVN